MINHPLLKQYPKSIPYDDENFYYTFMGAKIRKGFISVTPPPDAPEGDTSTSLGPETTTDMWETTGEELFGMIDLAETAKAAKNTYTVVDLGAGYGRWLVYAEMFRRAFNPSVKARYVGIEGDPTHYRWMIQHFQDNGLDPADHDLRCAVISDKRFVWFMKNSTPAAWYGQGICTNPIKVAGMFFRKHVSGLQIPIERRWGMPVTTVLKQYPFINLIDIDLQGIELDVFLPAIDVLNQKVARVHIGTHTPEIEWGMKELFGSNGWELRWDFPGMGVRETPYGPVSFQDGAQSWINPRLGGCC